MKPSRRSSQNQTAFKEQCTDCPIKGLVPEICQIHRRQMEKREGKSPALSPVVWTGLGVTLAAGAGIGLAGSVAVLAVAPALGAKAVLGHAAGYHIAGAASATGAGISMGINKKGRHPPKATHPSRLRLGPGNRYARIPYTLSKKRRNTHDG